MALQSHFKGFERSSACTWFPNLVPAVPDGERQRPRAGPAGRPRPRWVALWRDAEGRHKKTLGPAWVKPHGKSPKGATRWRAADGPKPDGFLSPRDAQQALRDLLASAPKERLPARVTHTFGEACDEWLRYVEHDRGRRSSTVRDHRNTVRR